VKPLPNSIFGLFSSYIVDILAAPRGLNGMNLSSDCAKTESFLPFGSGSRACVGQKFVILAISMLIASLLRNYEVRCNNCYAYALL